MTDSVNDFKNKLEKEHLLYTMIDEHEIILGYLNELEILNLNIQKCFDYKDAKNIIDDIKQLIEIIIGAEPHHQREERVLFVELEKNNIMGPPKVMRWEHHEMRELKHDIKKFAETSMNKDFVDVKKNFNFAIPELVDSLREHIFKENNVLYPMALRIISDNKKWLEMKNKCDEIGYCSFTPMVSIK